MPNKKVVEKHYEYDEYTPRKKSINSSFTPAAEIALSGVNKNSVYYNTRRINSHVSRNPNSNSR